MNPNHKNYRPYLRDYLARTDRPIKGTASSQKIICPNHADSDASCHVNDETLWCYGCGFRGDIYDLVALDTGARGMREQSAKLDEIFGNATEAPKIKAPERKATARGVPYPLHPDEADKIFNQKSIVKIGEFMKLKDPETPIYYKNKFGLVDGADVRLFDEKGNKTVITFWWDGSKLKAKAPPLLLWGRDQLETNPDKPVLISEGVKAAQAACALSGFVSMTWNQGTGNVGRHDWSPLEGRSVYIFPDDDQPGMAAARQIKLKLPQAIICQPVEEAREIKSKGADIVEALQVRTPQELAKYILSHSQPDEGPTKGEWKPFTVLGTGDDHRLYCVDRHGRLQSYDCGSLSKTKLLTLADLAFWEELFPKKSGFEVDDAVNWLIAQAAPDFDTDIIRGRGAWSEKNGDLCYHDGRKTIGKPSPKRMYIRKVRKDIGLGSPMPDQSQLRRIRDIVKQFSFKTHVDACRLLNWSTLAPFGGALPWRPAILVTGESGSGKSTVMDMVMRPISQAMARTGGGSTEAGIRQAVGNDSRAIILEEAEGDTQMKRQLREALFSLMRQSTSDDAPQIAKGTAGDQRGLTFTMRSMFCFLSIDPQIEHSADDNRMFRIDLVKADGASEDDFKKLESELSSLLTEDMCNSIRSMTFDLLPEIITLGRRLAPICRDCSGRDMRFGLADGLLWASYWLIWDERANVTDEYAREFLTCAYGERPEEPRRNDAAEMIERIFDQPFEVSGDLRKRMTIREACLIVRDGYYLTGEDVQHTMRNEIKEALGRLGIKMMAKGDVAFAIRHHEIQRILDVGADYGRSLWRHPGVTEKSTRIRLNGAQKTCVIIGGLLEGNKPVAQGLDVPAPEREY